MAQTKGRKTAAAGKKSAAAKKKTTSGTSSAGVSRKPVQKKTEPSDLRLRGDILFLVALAFCVLLFIGNLGFGGVLGKAVSSVSFGLFGLMAYLLPFLLFYSFLFILANGTGRFTGLRLGGMGGLYVFICGFFQLVLYGYEREFSFTDYYTQSALDRSGGGFCGGVLVKIFGTAFGTIGCYIVILIGLVIFTIMLTQKPLVSVLRERSEHAYDAALVQREERHELIEMRREARKAELEERSRKREEAALARERAAKEREMAAEARKKEARERRLSDAALDASGGQKAGSQPLQIITLSDETDVADEAFRTDLSDEVFDTGKKKKKTRDRRQKPAKAANDASLSDIERELKAAEDELAANILDYSIKAEPDPAPEEPADIFDAGEEVFGNDVLQEEILPKDGWAYPEDMLRSGAARSRKAAKKSPAGKKEEMTDARAEAAFAEKEDPSEQTAKQTGVKTPPETVSGTSAAAASGTQPKAEKYVFPPLSLLKASSGDQAGDSREYLKETAALLKQTLHTFGVEVTINHISCGPTVTRYELTPQMGIKVSKILSLTDDIKLNLAAADIRIEAPIPGKAAIGIEVPNKTNLTVMLRDLLESQAFRKQKSKLAFAVGKDIAGQPVIADIAKMPHLLIAGATGSGKSVCINALIMSILYKASPDEVKFIMIDPKVVELSVYNGIPHLFIPVVTDPKKATGALNWAVSEMTDRYQRFAEMGVRDLAGYNARIDAMPEPQEGSKPQKMSRIVIIVDELADLMMVAKNEAEDAIVRLAQLARAAGLHLIIATQRPSVDVITGLIKANMPSRIALSVTSGVDSRTILDMNGAEKLLGKGDMLFYPQGYQKPARVQCAYVSDEEIQDVVDFLKEHHEAQPYDSSLEEKLNHMAAGGGGSAAGEATDRDALFADAGKLIIEKDKASIGMLQRAFRIGFNRAARIMDQLCEAGIVGEEEGTKPRRILMSMEQFENYLEEY